MLICKHKGMTIAVLTRNEHCPPHVHVGNNDWDARFKFSFWHNSVDLWDVEPNHKAPAESVLEELRLVIENPVNLRKARQCWWTIHSSTFIKTCLDNKYWDPINNEEIDGKNATAGTPQIQLATYDPANDETTLTFAGGAAPLRIKL